MIVHKVIEILGVILIVKTFAQREDGFDSGEYTLTNPTTKVFRFGKKNLSCFTCNSIKDVDSCYKVDSQTNLVQCVHQNETFCKVRRVEYTQTDITNDRQVMPWSMERGCASECSNFCVNMGARTKITYCTSCCNSDGCNIDNTAMAMIPNFVTTILVILLLLNVPGRHV